MKRVVTALLLIPFALYCVFLAPLPVFYGALAILSSLCFFEYSGLVAGYDVPAPPPISYGIGIAFLLIPESQYHYVFLLAPLLFAWAIRTVDVHKALSQAATTLLGIAYIYGAWLCGAYLHKLDPRLLFFSLSINWVGDTAAFFVGKAIGRHKLAPVISPGKSWEGAIGSILVCAICGALYLNYTYGFPLWSVALVSVAACIAGQAGDLAESALKRGAGKKDSGNLLPGHGGWLDRLDSSLFSMPVVWIVVSQFANQIHKP